MRRRSHRLQRGMKIAVIGKGNIGGSLGSKWLAAGHDVVYGARDGSGEGPGGAPVRTIGDALKDADVVVLAVPGQVVCQPLAALGPGEQLALRVKAKAHSPGSHHFRVEVTSTDGDALYRTASRIGSVACSIDRLAISASPRSAIRVDSSRPVSTSYRPTRRSVCRNRAGAKSHPPGVTEPAASGARHLRVLRSFRVTDLRQVDAGTNRR